jgi:hypothetical protein
MRETVEISSRADFVPEPAWLNSVPDIRSSSKRALDEMWEREAEEGFSLPRRKRIAMFFRRLRDCLRGKPRTLGKYDWA